jgi:hypothetical protein
MEAQPPREPSVFGPLNVSYDMFFPAWRVHQTVLELCFHFINLPTTVGLLRTIQTQLPFATVTLFATESDRIPGAPPYIANFVRCNVILKDAGTCPEAERRVIEALQAMDPPAEDIQIERAYDVVPRRNSNLPTDLADMPAFGRQARPRKR